MKSLIYVATFAFVGITSSAVSLAQSSPSPEPTALSATPSPGASAETIASPPPAPSEEPLASPRPRHTPAGFSYRGFERTYAFFRNNTSSNLQGGAATAVDQASLNNALSLHVEDNFYSYFSAAATYFYAFPFDDHCSLPQEAYVGSPCVTQPMPGLRPDDTLPGYRLSTLNEGYLSYANPTLALKVGDQIFNTPWANPSDSRVKPAAFQGVNFTYTIDSQFDVQLADMIRFQRTTSNEFDRSTNLTTYTPVLGLGGAISVPVNIYDPAMTTLETPGFFFGRIGYKYGKGARVALNVMDYNFSGIANMTWGDARYLIQPASRFQPYVAVQGGYERNIGDSLVGKIQSTVAGIQGGFNLSPRLLVTAGFDNIPEHTDAGVNLNGTGLTCSATSHTIGLAKGVPTATASLPYFLPSGGTANCTANPDGTANIYYGGWASPYTYSYATDPLFTTSLTQGMADRASPGNAYKIRGTYTNVGKQLTTYVSYASYRYTNPGFPEITEEADFDLTYDFFRVPASGPYRGPSFRYRYGDRSQSGGAAYGGLPDFRYNRFQFEYDF